MSLHIMLKVIPNLFRAVIYSFPYVSVRPRQQHKDCVRLLNAGSKQKDFDKKMIVRDWTLHL